MIKLNDDINYNDLKEILLKYNFFDENKHHYFNRKENVGNLIYDHFFQTLYNRVSPSNELDLDDFIRSIKFCNTDYKYIINDNKINFNFSKRIFFVTNFYNILLYEIYVNKIFKSIISIINKNGFDTYLLDKKFFGFYSVFDYNYNIDNNGNELFTILGFKHYYNGWNNFDTIKNKLLLDNKFVFETDITSFYDSINHDSLILLLSEFFRIYGIENSDNFMYEFTNTLFKVNGYKKNGLPQGVMASDIMASIFLWLLFFLHRDINGFRYKDGYFELSDGIKFINYNDDFIFFSNDKIKLDRKFNVEIKGYFDKFKLNINYNKTTNILETTKYNNNDKINFELIKSGDINEINNFLKLFLGNLRKSTKKLDIKILKKYFKWIGIISKLEKKEQNNFFNKFFNIINLNGVQNDDKIKKFFLLLIISSKDFLLLFNGINNILNGKFESYFLNSFLKPNIYLLTESVLLKFFVDLRGTDYDLLKKFLKSELKKINNKLIFSYLDDERKPLKLIIQDNGLFGLHNVLYIKSNGENYKENFKNYFEDILSIKLYSLYGINTNNKELSKFMKNESTPLHIKKIGIRMQTIIDDLIILKNIFSNYYLKNPSFLSDTYSLLNILLTFLIYFKNNKIKSIKINGGDEPGYINIDTGTSKNDKKSIREFYNDFDINTIYLFFYIAKKRAEFNHKEIFGINKGINSFIYKKFEDVTVLNDNIGKTIQYLLNKISKELQTFEQNIN